jgi:IclR-like helix-turn-helix domain-containing protein
LTNHALVLLCIAHDPGVRLRDIAASVGITERSAYGIVTDLAAAGYVVKDKDAAAIATRSSRLCRCRGPPARARHRRSLSPSRRRGQGGQELAGTGLA